MDIELFVSKIEQRLARVGIIGMGYVGVPLMLAFVNNEFDVIGFDTNKAKIASLMAGKSYIKHIKHSDIEHAKQSGRFKACSEFDDLLDCDIVLICVPTPLNDNREPDMSYIRSVLQEIKAFVHCEQLIVLESTTYPGTTDELVRSVLESETGLVAGKHFYLAFSPEREDPGNKLFATQQVPKVVGGITPECTEAASALYGAVFDKVIPVTNARTAEMTKLLENIYRSVNIALVNELKMVCEQMNINIWEVVEAAASKPFGFMPFYPGPGLGGHCIPVDPFYLTWKAREYGLTTRFIELAGEINTGMHHYVLDRIALALNNNGKPINGSNILILGIAYKKNMDDVRESPAIPIIRMLLQLGARIRFHDSFVQRLEPMRQLPVYEKWYFNTTSMDLDNLETFDAVVIVTDHDGVDYERIVRESLLVIDCRNATKNVKYGREKVVRA